MFRQKFARCFTETFEFRVRAIKIYNRSKLVQFVTVDLVRKHCEINAGNRSSAFVHVNNLLLVLNLLLAQNGAILVKL